MTGRLKVREPKEDDQEKSEFCLSMICEFMKANLDIDPALWMGAFLSFIATGMHVSGGSFQQFCETLDQVKEHYKGMWDEERK